MMNKYLIIYHKEDNDGVFSGAIIYDYLKTELKVDDAQIKLFGSEYNELANFAKSNNPEELHKEYNSIIMTDISFNDPLYMKKLYDEFQDNFIWCDHHAPIIKASFEHNFYSCPGIRNTQKSAILCVYEFLYDNMNEIYSQIDKKQHPKFPELFRILSGWDSWSYEREGYDFEYVRNINKGITIEFNLNINKILEVVHYIISIYQDKLVKLDIMYENDLINNMYNLGKSLNEYDDITMENIIKNSGDKSWNIVLPNKDKGRPSYLQACAIFHQGATNSTMFKSLKKTNISQGLVFKHSPNGNWVLSMYNINDDHWFHCGEFLKERYNGGGHKGAAGCTLSQEQFINILQRKQL